MPRIEGDPDQVDAHEEEEGGECNDPEDLADDIEAMEMIMKV